MKNHFSLVVHNTFVDLHSRSELDQDKEGYSPKPTKEVGDLFYNIKLTLANFDLSRKPHISSYE